MCSSLTDKHRYSEIPLFTEEDLKQLTMLGEPEDVDSDATVKRPQLTTTDLKKASRWQIT
jgi:hypothetical protein